MQSRVVQQYNKIYESLRFERAALFEAIRKKYQINSVLYPGSNIHVTPSFYFPHVVYVDAADNARQFFKDENQVLEFIRVNKKYDRAAFIRFINEDFTNPLPLHEEEFDLIISLFAGGISKSCVRYLKSGGYLLTNNHHNDAADALYSGNFNLAAIARKKQKKYEFMETDLKQYLCSVRKPRTKTLCKNSSFGGIQYKEDEDFYVFKKVSD